MINIGQTGIPRLLLGRYYLVYLAARPHLRFVENDYIYYLARMNHLVENP